MTLSEAWNAIVNPWRKPREPAPTLPADVAQYFAECREAERIRDLDAALERDIALRRAERLKRSAAAHLGIERRKGRA
jgi:hypothetical protein